MTTPKALASADVPSAPTDTVARLAVETLIANGLDQLYCVPGVQNDDFFDAVYFRQAALRPIHARHEQGAAYMALGAALATGRPQVCSVVPGPGFLNATAALSTAWARHAPVLALVGQIPSGLIGQGRGALHEIPDQLGIMARLTKSAARISTGVEAHGVLQAALTAMTSGRPGPVGVEVPVDVWKAKLPAPAARADLVPVPPAGPAIDDGAIEEAARLLSAARRPIIVVGGGAQDLGADVLAIAEALDAPVAGFRAGQGVISGDHPRWIGLPVCHALWKDCDVVLGLGTRLQSQKGWGVDSGLTIVHIDAEPAELTRTAPATLGITARLEEAVPRLAAALARRAERRPAWAAAAATAKDTFAARYARELAPQLAWLDAIRGALPDDGILVDELTQVGYVSRFAYPTRRPRTFLSTGYQGTLGWGYATALGAQHARRDVPVVSIAGDGGAMFTIAEMATAVRHAIPLTAIVFNDNAFGNVRRFQIEMYDNRPIASDLTSPDFVRLAESFGARGWRAQTPDALAAALTRAFADPAPTVIEVPMGDVPSPWPFLMLPKVRG